MGKDFHTDFKYRKIKKPNKFLATIVRAVFRGICKKRNVSFVYDESFLPYQKKQVIYLCQHASRDDYIYVSAGLKSLDNYYVCGYQNIFQKSIYPLMKKLGVIAKYLYQPDTQSIKQMFEAIKNGGNIILFPEGIQSTSGSQHPINIATMKFLMKLKLPVILVKLNGAYFTRTRYSADIKKGKITVTYSKLFDNNDFKNNSEEQLYEKLLTEFKFNEWNGRVEKVAYEGKKPNISGLENIIYKCPHCLKEGIFSTVNDEMTCSSCGFSVKMDKYYDIFSTNKDKELPFKNVDEWFKWQRKQVSKEILDDNFILNAQVEINKLNTRKLDNNNSMLRLGKGCLTLTNKGLTYKGSYKGEDVELFFEANGVFSLTISLAYEFDLYYKNDYFNFKLIDNKEMMTKWMLSAEEIHNLYDDRWAKASKEAYDG